MPRRAEAQEATSPAMSRRGLFEMFRPSRFSSADTLQVAPPPVVNVAEAPTRFAGEEGVTRLQAAGLITVGTFGIIEAVRRWGPKAAKNGITKVEEKALDAAKRFVYDEKTRKVWEAVVGGAIGERDFRIIGERDYLIRVKKEKVRELFGVSLPSSVTRGGGELTMHYSALVGINGSGLPIPNEFSDDGTNVTVTLPFPTILRTDPDIHNKDFHLSVERGLAERVIAQLKRNSGMDSMSPDKILKLAFGLMKLAEEAIPKVYLQSDTRFQRAAIDALTERTKADLKQLKNAYKLPYEHEDVKFGPKPDVKDPLPDGVFIDLLDEPTITPENPLQIPTTTTIGFASASNTRIQAQAPRASGD